MYGRENPPTRDRRASQNLANVEQPGTPEQPGRDKPLAFHWRALDPAWTQQFGLPPAPSIRARRAQDAIVLDAILEAAGAGRWISYSRRWAFYAGKRRYHGTYYTFRTVVPAIDHLTAAGVIDHEKARAGSRGWQSRFGAAPPLLEIPLPLVRCDPRELVRLKRRGDLVDYRDTARTDRWRRHLREANEAIDGCDLDIDAPGQVRDGNVIRFGDHVVYPAMRSLYRVFNDGWRRGGRAYGGWWQQAKKRDRAHITIDGEPTAESDHSQLHPRLLYRRVGADLDGDAYTIPGHPRHIGKVALNVLLNAKTYHAAIGAVANAIGGPNPRRQAGELIDAMKRRHKPIARFFHSGVGLELQAVDAGMAETVMRELRRDNIVALPIHDSFIVQERHEGRLEEAMADAFENAVFEAA